VLKTLAARQAKRRHILRTTVPCFLLICCAASRICMLIYGSSFLYTQPKELTGGGKFAWAAPNAPMLRAPAYFKSAKNYSLSHDTWCPAVLPESLYVKVCLFMHNLYHTKSGRTDQLIERQQPGRAPPFA